MVQIIMVDRNMVKVDLVGEKEIYSRGVTHCVYGYTGKCCVIYGFGRGKNTAKLYGDALV